MQSMKICFKGASFNAFWMMLFTFAFTLFATKSIIDILLLSGIPWAHNDTNGTQEITSNEVHFNVRSLDLSFRKIVRWRKRYNLLLQHSGIYLDNSEITLTIFRCYCYYEHCVATSWINSIPSFRFFIAPIPNGSLSTNN